MLFRFDRKREEAGFQALERRSASELGLAEKDLENWLVRHPALLFGGEEVLVVAQSVSGARMADMLALDTDGNLVIVEIKRDWSDRETVGQLLEYAADMANATYEDLERLYQSYRGKADHPSLRDGFRDLVDDPEVGVEGIPTGYRVCIVAPHADDGLRRIIAWLRSYGVPISYIPFALYADGDSDTAEILLEIERLPKIREAGEGAGGEWRGDWFFNTNETNAPGAYRRMLEQNVVAIYGFETGPEPLEGSTAGQRVFAYVNRKGIVACGRVVDGRVFADKSVFGGEREFHLKVNWETVVTDDCGVTNAQVRAEFDQGLPVRKVFCGLSRAGLPDWIAAELRQRPQSAC